MYSKSIRATARVCTSIVRPAVTQLAMGTVVIGSFKTMSVHINNLSDMPATLSFKLNSKILTYVPPRACMCELQCMLVVVGFGGDCSSGFLRSWYPSVADADRIG